MSQLIRPVLRGIPAYKAGKPPVAGPDGKSFKLSSNENPYPPLPSVLSAIEESCGGINRYPDPSNAEIAAAVADFLTTAEVEIKPENLVFGTGSVALLYHLLQTVCDPGAEVIFAWRSFEAYPIAVQVAGATSVKVPVLADGGHDLDAMLAAITDKTRAIMVCTPNNPTGTVVRHDDLVKFVDAVPHNIMVVIDEAYVEFIDDPDAARGLEFLAGRPNVVVLRTFSKAYGLAGLRVGYAVAEPELITAFAGVGPAFGVSVPAQIAVLASLQADHELLERVDALKGERTRVLAALRELGFELPDSQGNFIWLPAGELTAAYAQAFIAAGLSVRPFPAGEPQDGVRISVGEVEANDRVIEVARTLAR